MKSSRRDLSDGSSHGERDILSYLPDPIRTHIVSFLPTTKEAIKTQILSRRWRNTSTSLSNLNFHSCNFKSFFDFKNFVDKTLILHDGSDVPKFHLHIHLSAWITFDATRLLSADHLSAWITFAVQHKVTDLVLCLKGMPRKLERLPLSFFTCNTLSTLELTCCRNLKWPTCSYFPMLKDLCFEMVTFFDEKVTSKLFSKSTFPVLETLTIFNCEFKKIHTLPIYFSTLKLLKLYLFHPIIVNLSIPILSEFDYESTLPPNISCGTLSSTNRVILNFELPDSTSDKLVFRSSVRMIIAGLHNVKDLTLCSTIIETLSQDPDLLDYLPALYSRLNRIFFVIMPTKRHVETLTCLLMSSPNLKTLRISFEEYSTSPDTIHMQGYRQLNELSLVECLKNLERVELEYFGGLETEMDLVRDLLKSACILEDICFSYTDEIYKDEEKKLKIEEKLSSFKKISPYAELKFLSKETSDDVDHICSVCFQHFN